MLLVRIALLASACFVALSPSADAIKVTNLTTGQVLFRDGFESVPAYTGNYLPGSGDFDPVASVGTWDLGAFGGGDDEPAAYDLQVVSATSAPNPGPFEGSHYLRLEREGAATAAFARFAPQAMPGDTLQFDMMLATSANYNSGQGELSMIDSNGNNVARLLFNNGYVAYRRHGIQANVATGFSHPKGEWMHVVLEYTLGAPKFSLTLNGTTASNLDLFLAQGTTPANIAGFRIAPGMRSGGTFFGGLHVDASVPLPTLLVDRTTGEVTLANNSAVPITNIVGYSLLSPSGALDFAGWTTIAGHYDASTNGGNALFDTTSWTVLSTPSSTHELTETTFTGSGATLGVGQSVSLGTPWRVGRNQDVELQLIVDDGTATGRLLTVAATYIPVTNLAGDFNVDGVVDMADYVVWRNNLGGNESVLSGNGSGDSVVDTADYQLWKSQFGSTLPGAQHASLAPVPEPSATVPLLWGATVLTSLWLRSRGAPLA